MTNGTLWYTKSTTGMNHDFVSIKINSLTIIFKDQGNVLM